jgi:hypothetical protein
MTKHDFKVDDYVYSTRRTFNPRIGVVDGVDNDQCLWVYFFGRCFPNICEEFTPEEAQRYLTPLTEDEKILYFLSKLGSPQEL